MADSPSELQFEIEKLERKHAEHPEGRFFVPLANAYRKMGDVETAEALLRAGVERHPDYLSAHIVLGRCLADRGAVSQAEEEFRFVLVQDPQNLIAKNFAGQDGLSWITALRATSIQSWRPTEHCSYRCLTPLTWPRSGILTIPESPFPARSLS